VYLLFSPRDTRRLHFSLFSFTLLTSSTRHVRVSQRQPVCAVYSFVNLLAFPKECWSTVKASYERINRREVGRKKKVRKRTFLVNCVCVTFVVV